MNLTATMGIGAGGGGDSAAAAQDAGACVPWRVPEARRAARTPCHTPRTPAHRARAPLSAPRPRHLCHRETFLSFAILQTLASIY
jgi:hypothetical protein